MWLCERGGESGCVREGGRVWLCERGGGRVWLCERGGESVHVCVREGGSLYAWKEEEKEMIFEETSDFGVECVCVLGNGEEKDTRFCRIK